MTKAEKAEFEKLKNERIEAENDRDLFASFYISKKVLPDIPKPVGGKMLGYSFNEITIRVYETWSTCVSNGRGHDEADFKHGSQNAITQYSTKLLALKALRHEVAMKHAKDLVRIDKMIEIEK